MLSVLSTAPSQVPPASPTLDHLGLGPLVPNTRWVVGNQVKWFWHWSRQLASEENKEGLQRPEVSNAIVSINDSIGSSEKSWLGS